MFKTKNKAVSIICIAALYLLLAIFSLFTASAYDIMPLNTQNSLYFSYDSPSQSINFDIPSHGKISLDYMIEYPYESKSYTIELSSTSALLDSHPYGENVNNNEHIYGRLPAGRYILTFLFHNLSGRYYTAGGNNSHATITVRYTINYQQENDNYEQEWNNTKESANLITFQKAIIGSFSVLAKTQGIGNDICDVDYYKFTTADPGRIETNFRNTAPRQETEYSIYEVEFYDSLDTLISSSVIMSNQTDIDLNAIRLPKGDYYIRLSGPDGELTMAYYDYILTLDFTPEPVGAYEQEANDKQRSATFTEPGKTITGNLNSANDVDWYAIDVANAGGIGFNFTHAKVDSGDWKITVQDELGNTISENIVQASETSKTLAPTEVKQGLNFVIVEKNTAFSGVDYKLTANFSAAEKVITLTIGDQYMIVNGIKKEIDPGRGTVPIIVDSRTLVPIRAIVEEFGGSVSWDDSEQKVTLVRGGTTVEMWIKKSFITVNGENRMIDVSPQINNGRTFVPLRFVSENLGVPISWDGATQTVTMLVYSA
jgi:hypothetical protein